MISEICGYLHNYFDRDMPSYEGVFTVTDSIVYEGGDMSLQNGQYFKIEGSVFNNGVWQYGVDTLTAETFTGTVQTMAVPPAFLQILSEIEAWQEKNSNLENPAMSPYTSESFNNYSYTKSAGDSDASLKPQWALKYGGRLSQWKKL